MTEVITVAPSHGAWIVERSASKNPQSFLSGATAEAAARQLGEAIARGGQSAEIQVFLRNGELASRFLCPATRNGVAQTQPAPVLSADHRLRNSAAVWSDSK
jgi:hypothetical protein